MSRMHLHLHSAERKVGRKRLLVSCHRHVAISRGRRNFYPY